MYKIKLPKQTDYEKFFENESLSWIVEISKNKKKLKDYRINADPHPPDLKDLYFLYQTIRLNNRTTILEYGCGWSTLIMHLALIKNKKVNNNNFFSRCGNPYQLFSLDASKKFIEIAKKRIENYSKNTKKINFYYSPVRMTKFNGRYCTEYKNHPLINPDFIYLDAPSQWGVSNKIENFTTDHHSMMPMACDILKYEHFLTPGTIIVTDGRTANVRFLLANFQRKWKHLHMKQLDQHYFCLSEQPLGKWNMEQINFYNKK